MAKATVNSTINVAGLAIDSVAERTDDGQIAQTPSLPAGSAGTLSTRTDDNTGVCTLSAGHGLTTDDCVDVYWSGGVRYGMDITVVDGNNVTVDLGAGDNLPDETTAIVVTKRVVIDMDLDGDLIKLIAAKADQRCHMEFEESDETEILAVELTANEAWSWVYGQGTANPLTGNPIGAVKASCGSSSEAAAFQMGILYDSAT